MLSVQVKEDLLPHCGYSISTNPWLFTLVKEGLFALCYNKSIPYSRRPLPSGAVFSFVATKESSYNKGMEAHELTPELIIEWASNHAPYEELEAVAKGVYNVYKAEQRESHPEDFKKAKAYKHKIAPSKKTKKRKRNDTRLFI